MKLSSVITVLYILCIGIVTLASPVFFSSLIPIGYIGFLTLTVLITVNKIGYGTSLNDIGEQVGTMGVSFATFFALVFFFLLTRIDYYTQEFLYNWGRIITVVIGVGLTTLALLIGPRINKRFLRSEYDADAPFPIV